MPTPPQSAAVARASCHRTGNVALAHPGGATQLGAVLKTLAHMRHARRDSASPMDLAILELSIPLALEATLEIVFDGDRATVVIALRGGEVIVPKWGVA